jgi:uncharacterized membrane protein YagU involved in acid resistance
MNWTNWLVWGFAATVLMSVLMAGSQGFGLTRMSIPYMLGTMFTPDRDRAKTIGVVVHIIDGWIFSLVYVAAFAAWGGPAWWKGAAIGIVHALFVITAGMAAAPGLHPRMASERRGPTVVRGLEPPGFLALHYGARTPVSIVVAHVLFGIVLGTFYRP